MKIVLKFTNGDSVTIKNFNDLNRKGMSEDIFKTLKEIKDNDKPIVITGENGEVYENTGKELLSLEIVLD